MGPSASGTSPRGTQQVTGRALPRMAAGARVAILDAGAYGAVMSSTYNARPLAAEAMLDPAAGPSGFAVIRRRQRLEDLWAAEIVPDWLK